MIHLSHDKIMTCLNFLYDRLYQASVYGIGVCAEFGGAAFKPVVGGMHFLFATTLRVEYIDCTTIICRCARYTVLLFIVWYLFTQSDDCFAL